MVEVGSETLSTRKVDAQEHPEWHQILTFEDYTLSAGNEAIISVYATKVLKDRHIGSAKLQIPTVFNELKSDVLELHTLNGKLAGVLSVKVIITNNKSNNKRKNARKYSF